MLSKISRVPETMNCEFWEDAAWAFYQGLTSPHAAIRPSTPVKYSKTGKAQQVFLIFFHGSIGGRTLVNAKSQRGKGAGI